MGCTVLRGSLRHCQISGERGRESGLPTRSLDRNENSRDKSQAAVFLRCNFFTAFFRCVFRRTFLPHFSPRFLFRCTFRHIFRQARPCKLSCQRISIHVTTTRLCQMRWHNISNTEKHAIMEEGADMPETHCLSHPLCLTTLMENTCDTHCAPSQNQNQKNKSVIFGFLAALFALRTLSPDLPGCSSFTFFFAVFLLSLTVTLQDQFPLHFRLGDSNCFLSCKESYT